MIRIGLSLDFDFFSYEDPCWDFGHSEESSIYQSSAVWALRYLHFDLEKEAGIHKANFYPLDIFEELQNKNIGIMDNAAVGFADSHRFAYNFFAPYGDQIDEIINIDAHHDCWPYLDNKIDCGNWLNALGKKSTWVHPTWKNPYNDESPSFKIDTCSWPEFSMKEDNRVVAMFVCRSSAWVPPHFDNLYARFVETISDKLSPIILQGVKPRDDINYQALAIQRASMKNFIDDVNSHQSDCPDKA